MDGSRFGGKVALVTGGASGIGAATARRMAAEGASVAIGDIDVTQGTETANSIAASGGVASFHRCDVSALSDWERFVDDVVGRHGRLDVVFANAYAIVRGPTHLMAEDDWDRQVAVCLKQVFLAVRTCIQHLIDAHGVMVCTSSVHALVGFSGDAAYDASKGGVSALVRELASEYAPDVRINAVLPGGILTPAWDDTTEEHRAAFASQTPIRRLGTAEEVAAVVCFLASDDASFVTGANVVVDGGYTATKD
jgi:NAD(P)-dependent dehydrogenase (short-subunit alcohol dehydrogenase family)